MKYPEFLKPGGRIGFIAPSFGCDMEPYRTCFESALCSFEKIGFQTVIGPNARASKGIGKSNTAEACAKEINDFFTQDRSDILISCGGGETMCEDLEFVDFQAISASKPKWFLGYSDNTNLTFTLPTLCDIAAIYGPCASNFGMRPWHESIQDTFELLKGAKLSVSNYEMWEKEQLKDEENPLIPYNVTEKFDIKIANGIAKDDLNGSIKADFSGRLIGGCLDCLVTLCGTQFDKVKEFDEKYSKDGLIWFMEACELSPMGIRRAIWQLDNAGWFKHVKGFLIGRPYHFGEDEMGMNQYNAVTGIIEKYGVPILMDVDLGHLPPMMPLISGAMADIKADLNHITVDMRLE